MTVSAFSSVSVVPPTILVCLASKSKTASLMDEGNTFGVSLLGAGQSDISNRFAGRDAAGDRFDGIACIDGADGLPLIANAAATLECIVADRAVVGDHTIYFGTVGAVTMGNTDPLLYYRGDYQQIVYGRRKLPR
jgi:flavin reductase (DIM6/NTAB) family NADH-FMN oxidoreductase RutF